MKVLMAAWNKGFAFMLQVGRKEGRKELWSREGILAACCGAYKYVDPANEFM